MQTLRTRALDLIVEKGEESHFQEVMEAVSFAGKKQSGVETSETQG